MNQQLDKNHDPEMLEEYDFNGGVRGKYAARFAEGANIVVLDLDVAKAPRIQSESITHMTGEQLINAFQSQAARGSVGASTVRGRGNVGTAKAARAFLRTIDLATFGSGSSARLNHSLEPEAGRRSRYSSTMAGREAPQPVA
ncbi:MAG TPA: hypothetical protein VN956_21875 [Pyrinomonadaceae bacterium]|nr:hypothetical protein [Pyrinomonadaceae bacterium]